MLRALLKAIFLTQAAVEVGRERIEDCLDVLTEKAGECKLTGRERLQEIKETLIDKFKEVADKVWQRSETLENQAKDSLRRQVADFSMTALSDSTEINELRAEIATLRAEIAELKSTRAAV